MDGLKILMYHIFISVYTNIFHCNTYQSTMGILDGIFVKRQNIIFAWPILCIQYSDGRQLSVSFKDLTHAGKLLNHRKKQLNYQETKSPGWFCIRLGENKAGENVVRQPDYLPCLTICISHTILAKMAKLFSYVNKGTLNQIRLQVFIAAGLVLFGLLLLVMV